MESEDGGVGLSLGPVGCDVAPMSDCVDLKSDGFNGSYPVLRSEDQSEEDGRVKESVGGVGGKRDRREGKRR